MKQSYSLYELNEYINRVIALNFAEPIWINCEISQVSNVRGNYYLELVEQDDDQNIKAKISAMIWYKNFLFIKNKLGELTQNLLQPGRHIQIKVSVQFNEKYGLKLLIEDIDPSYTMGQLEIKRQLIIERLTKANLLEKNKGLSFPKVIQRIAIISSATAAGYQDFVQHCKNNRYQYAFTLDLYPAAMQGQNTESEVCNALLEIRAKKKSYDIIVIIRGGGSKLDLSFFDNYNIGHHIANSPLPVLTGIGHDVDQSVADLTAYINLKTPTAVADFIVENNAEYEEKIMSLALQIQSTGKSIIKQEESRLQQLISTINYTCGHTVSKEHFKQDQIWKNIIDAARYKISTSKIQVNNATKVISANDPQVILNKGFALIKHKKKYIPSHKELKEQDQVQIEFGDGTHNAVIS